MTGEKSRHVVQLRMSEDEKSRLKKLADKTGISMSELIRQKVFSSDDRSVEQFAEERSDTMIKIQKLGKVENEISKVNRGIQGMMNNYNQMMKLLNSDRKKNVTGTQIKEHTVRFKYMAGEFEKLQKRIDDLWQS